MQTEQQTEHQPIDFEGLPVVSLEGFPAGYDNVEPVESLNRQFELFANNLYELHPDKDVRNALYSACVKAVCSGLDFDFHSYTSQVLESASSRVNHVLAGLQHPDVSDQADLKSYIVLIQPKCVAFAIECPDVPDPAIANFAIAAIDELTYRSEMPTGGVLASVKRCFLGLFDFLMGF